VLKNAPYTKTASNVYGRTQNEAREGGRERKTCEEDLKTCLAKPKVNDLKLLTLNVFIQ
jgi:hypothetical protein